MTDTCATCEHWSADLPPLATGIRRPDGADPQIGICQFYGPTIVAKDGFYLSLFPEVHADRTCGDWSPRYSPNEDGGERVSSGVVQLRSVA